MIFFYGSIVAFLILFLEIGFDGARNVLIGIALSLFINIGFYKKCEI